MLAASPATAAYDRLAAVYERWLTGDDAAERCLTFYRDAMRGPASDVLELGCGTGRISMALAAAGHRVVGLDGSRAMLARVACKLGEDGLSESGSLRLVHGAFDRLPFGDGSFDRVLMPMRTVGHLTGEEERRACFRDVARVLRPGGRFLLDHYKLDRSWAEAHDGVARLMYSGAADSAERAVAIWDRYDYDFSNSRMRCTVRVREVGFHPGDDCSEDVVFDFCWYALEELEALGAAAGLEVATRFGSFEGAPYDERSEDIVLTFAKPGDDT